MFQKIKCHKNSYRKGLGFTLIELIIVIAIILLFVVFGAPAFNRYNYKQELNTKALETKGVIDQAYLQSQNIQQGYDSVLVTFDSKEMISMFGDTDSCNDVTQAGLKSQIEGVDFDGFSVSLDIGNEEPAGDSTLICFPNSGIAQLFTYDSPDLEPSFNKISSPPLEIKIKLSSENYQDFVGEDGVYPNVYIKNIFGNDGSSHNSLMTEIKYE